MARFSLIYRPHRGFRHCILCRKNRVEKGLMGWRERPAPSGGVCLPCLRKHADVLALTVYSMAVFRELGSREIADVGDEIRMMAAALAHLQVFSVFAEEELPALPFIGILDGCEEEINRLEDLYGPLWKLSEPPPEEHGPMALLAWKMRKLQGNHTRILLEATGRLPGPGAEAETAADPTDRADDTR